MAQLNVLADAYNSQTEHDFRQGLQMRLAWTGDYAGRFDGDVGPETLRAIRDFQARHGLEATGIMDQPFLRLLLVESDRAETGTGFALVDDAVTGVRVGLPLSLVRDLGQTEIGHLWRSSDDGIEIETARFTDGGRTLDDLFAVLSTPSSERSVTAKTFGGTWFSIAGKESERSYLIRFATRDGELRGYSLSYDAANADVMEPFARVSANLFEPFAGEPAAARVAQNRGLGFGPMVDVSGHSTDMVAYADPFADARGGRLGDFGSDRSAPADKPADSSGTGFVVADGWLLTNAHVARSCKTILVGNHGVADGQILDEAADLALLHVSGETLGEPLRMAADAPRLGEDILALGFPLRSILADSLNVTRGNVSSLMGLMNDSRYLQISAPIQPGNSGGPLVDLSGRVVGVVTAKLNAVAVADLTGDIPQAINFAIRPEAAVAFLKEEGIAYASADPEAEFGSVPDATAKVKDSILPVVCLASEQTAQN
ncbi:serine protease [Consotaella aegiceratis]|uniref:serine protease n=1 Tax=Consotaella aegiceratis TaxID=3097961 RepID=UPI002F3EBBBA